MIHLKTKSFVRLLMALSMTLSTLGTFRALSVAKKPTILAYYYPWYIRDDWSRHDYVGTPTLGKYGTDSPQIAEQHISWSAEHGINGLFVSWWGQEHLVASHLKSGLLKATNLDRIKFAMFYESLGILDPEDGTKDGVVDFSEPQVMSALIADFQHLTQEYFDHPQYLKFSGRPVVGLYVSRTFRNFTQEHLERLQQAIGYNVYFIADEIFFGKQASPDTARNRQAQFDAYTAYNMFENAKVRPNDSALTYQAREAFPIFRQWAKHKTFIPSIFPSYQDFRGNKPLFGSPDEFATILDAASSIASPGSASAPQMILLTSFNEWWEGTTIEPTIEYGGDYLDAIQHFKKHGN